MVEIETGVLPVRCIGASWLTAARVWLLSYLERRDVSGAATMASYGYEDGYGYSSYGYGAYGYGYGGYSNHPFPNAAGYLSGPGSYAYISRPYGSSYAYETQNGGVYINYSFHTSTGYINSTSYSVSDGAYKYTSSYLYKNLTDRSGPSYGYGYGYGSGYYSGYYLYDINLVQSSIQTQSYVGNYDYADNRSSSSAESVNGYNHSDYSHITDTFYGGHVVAGSGYNYYVSSVTDPYGYTTYSSHTSTF